MTDETRDPINPLDAAPEPAAPLPAPEPMLDPVPEDEIAPDPPAPAASNGSGPTLAEVETAVLAAQGAARRAAARTPAPGPLLGAIQSDLEQLHAEATSTRRSVQLLALSLAAIAALVLLYAARGLRAGPVPTVKGA